MTGRYIQSTFVEHQREFVEHLQYGKQIDDFLDLENMQKRAQATKQMFWIWNLKNLETRFQLLEFVENILNLLTQFLCRMGQTLFQTSS